MNEGYKRCRICDWSKLGSASEFYDNQYAAHDKKRYFVLDKSGDDICNRCAESIQDSLKEFGDGEFEKDICRLVHKKTEEKGKVHNRLGRPRDFKGTNPVTQDLVDFYEAILTAEGMGVDD